MDRWSKLRIATALPCGRVNAMKTIMFTRLARLATRQAGRLWALGLAAGLALTMASADPADAHGEKSQAAFLRMRTLGWYDLKWSKTSVSVNEEYEISG